MARGSRLARLAALGLLGVLTLTGCDMPNNEFWRFGWPEGVTDEAESMRELWTGSVIAALIVGFLVWGLILYSVVAHRKRSDELPRQTAYNLPLEIAYTIAPFLIIAALFFFTVVTQNEVKERSDNPDETIAVNAFKWNWQFVYPETTGTDGEPVNTIGTSEEIPILVLPTDRTIRFEVASADVIHSFWVPEFLFKLDVIPGNENGRDNVFEVTVREEGAYVGRCAELCGTYHAYMNFEVRAVSGDDYDAYLAAREEGLDTFEALEEIGQPGSSSTTTPLELFQAKNDNQQQSSNG
ncbi:cytochrome c oxidase subunit II [Blastococcus sp. TML/M2B]|uniref:aa3-type cytochrome oxidase subunit II n=1 Tax=unclassified Blastococcus TaxID=2619396 RepID=UPI00190C0AC8|nr:MULTISPECIES: cytochrome c oxidase subunit II [unclassified Blastococcus]MBN1092344.1 cytochrome c oxidase subunit II [Blastococcus sp. TML/M2B]MBN1097563.1 cytochrome c oxidase subunit II [Blastococcus sp. TML/C7B]